MRMDLSIPLPVSEATVRAHLQARDLSKKDPEAGKRLEAVMQEFESLLLEQMIKEMSATVPEGGLFEKSRGQEIFNEMLHGEYAQLMEKRGGIGLAQFMLERMDPE